MGILSRFKDIMASNINALLDKCEDPEKMIDQTLRNLREDYAEVKKETAGVIADEKLAERRLTEAKAEMQKYLSAATKAVQVGNDDDARKLLAKKQKIEAQIPQLEQVYNVAHENAEKMRSMAFKLQNDIEELENRKDTVKAKMKVAKAQQMVNKAVSGTKSSEASLSAFERMEARADKMLDTAQAETELNSHANESADLLSKYAVGGSSDTGVDDELAAIKAQLGQ